MNIAKLPALSKRCLNISQNYNDRGEFFFKQFNKINTVWVHHAQDHENKKDNLDTILSPKFCALLL